jgi:hypothetical protein
MCLILATSAHTHARVLPYALTKIGLLYCLSSTISFCISFARQFRFSATFRLKASEIFQKKIRFHILCSFTVFLSPVLDVVEGSYT